MKCNELNVERKINLLFAALAISRAGGGLEKSGGTFVKSGVPVVAAVGGGIEVSGANGATTPSLVPSKTLTVYNSFIKHKTNYYKCPILHKINFMDPCFYETVARLVLCGCFILTRKYGIQTLKKSILETKN